MHKIILNWLKRIVGISLLGALLAYHLAGQSSDENPPSAVETGERWGPSESDLIHARREPVGWVFGRVMGFQGADKPLLPRQTPPTPLLLPPSSSTSR